MNIFPYSNNYSMKLWIFWRYQGNNNSFVFLISKNITPINTRLDQILPAIKALKILVSSKFGRHDGITYK